VSITSFCKACQMAARRARANPGMRTNKARAIPRRVSQPGGIDECLAGLQDEREHAFNHGHGRPHEESDDESAEDKDDYEAEAADGVEGVE